MTSRAPRQRGQRLVGELDPGAVPGDGDHVGRRRAGAGDGDGGDGLDGHGPIGSVAGSGRLRAPSGGMCLVSQTHAHAAVSRLPVSRVRARCCVLAVLRLLATPRAVPPRVARELGLPRSTHVPPARRARAGGLRRPPAGGAGVRARRGGLRARLGLPAARPARAAGAAAAGPARRPGRRDRPPRGPARCRDAVPAQGGARAGRSRW